MVDLPRGNLPPIEFAEKSAVDIEAAIITTYESITGRSLQPADPIRLFLLTIASIIVQQRSVIDFSAKQNLLSYAQSTFIDYIGEGVGVFRLEPKPAQTTIQFTLSAVQPSAFIIPAGTAITSGTLNFITTQTLEIPIGETVGTVTAQCQTTGEIGNNLLPGQIKTLVNPIAFVQSVKNTTTSQGGTNQEDDESLVERIRLAPASFSVAGPVDAYKYWARTASQAIVDVEVSTPTPGVVDVRPLLTNGELPGPEIIDLVDAVLSADDIRPLTDDVQVSAPDAVSYNLNVQYWIASDKASSAQNVQLRVNTAIEEYLVWQKTKIGRDINPDELTQRIISAGAKRVNIISPEFTVINNTQVAQEGTKNISYQGLEDG